MSNGVEMTQSDSLNPSSRSAKADRDPALLDNYRNPALARSELEHFSQPRLVARHLDVLHLESPSGEILACGGSVGAGVFSVNANVHDTGSAARIPGCGA